LLFCCSVHPRKQTKKSLIFLKHLLLSGRVWKIVSLFFIFVASVGSIDNNGKTLKRLFFFPWRLFLFLGNLVLNVLLVCFFSLCNFCYSKYYRFLSQYFLLFPWLRFFFSWSFPFGILFFFLKVPQKVSFQISKKSSPKELFCFFFSDFNHPNAWKMLCFNPKVRKKPQYELRLLPSRVARWKILVVRWYFDYFGNFI